MEHIQSLVDEDIGREIYNLWEVKCVFFVFFFWTRKNCLSENFCFHLSLVYQFD